MSNVLDDRRRGVEEAFFARQNEDLRLRLQTAERHAAEEARNLSASGILEEGAPAAPASAESAETAAALSLVPLVAVAWADDELSPKERGALLDALAGTGLAKGGAAYLAFESWLEEKPGDDLVEQWRAYVRALCLDLPPDDRDRLRERVLGQARAVAEAAGGFLGIGSISSAEQAVLDDLASTFRA